MIDEKSLMDAWLKEPNYYFIDRLKLNKRLDKLLSVAFCYNVYRRFNKNNKDHKHKEIIEFAEVFADNFSYEHKNAEFYCFSCRKGSVENCNICRVCACALSNFSACSTHIHLKTQKDNEKQILNEGKLIVSVVGPGWQFNNCWKNEITIAIAQRLYETKDWSGMPILADALQEAGCNENFLDHMRNRESKFCRGCWILDQLLDKRK